MNSFRRIGETISLRFRDIGNMISHGLRLGTEVEKRKANLTEKKVREFKKELTSYRFPVKWHKDVTKYDVIANIEYLLLLIDNLEDKYADRKADSKKYRNKYDSLLAEHSNIIDYLSTAGIQTYDEEKNLILDKSLQELIDKLQLLDSMHDSLSIDTQTLINHIKARTTKLSDSDSVEQGKSVVHTDALDRVIRYMMMQDRKIKEYEKKLSEVEQ